MARLGADVEAMRQRILLELDEVKRAEEALPQSGLVALTRREQLTPEFRALPGGYHLAARFRPAEGILAGDWYDVIANPDGRITVALVDVAGQGAEAGIFALRAKQLLLAAVREGRDPGDALGWVSVQLGVTDETFFTAVIVEIDPATGRARYANAGHLPATACCSSGHMAMEPTGPLIGPLPGCWETRAVEMNAGDVAVLYTDGLVEPRSTAGEQFGSERVDAIVAGQHWPINPDVLADELFDAVVEFAPESLTDDLTLVVIGRAQVLAETSEAAVAQGEVAQPAGAP